MPLAYVLDENQRGLLWRFVQRHNLKRSYTLDVIRVGDSDDLPLGSDDTSVLRWAERENRILVSSDRTTLATHLADHIRQGNRSPGIFVLRDANLRDVVEFLVCASYASEAEEWANRIVFIP